MKTPITAALLLVAAGSLSGASTAPRLTIDRDRIYAEPVRELRTLDIYAPAGAKNLPVVFWIHGGGWQAGDKTEMAEKPQAFVAKGCVFVSINYPMLPAVTIKQMTAHVAQAIAWVHRNIAARGGDPNRIFVMGHSAGAQLAALVCTDDRYLKAEGVSLNIIKGCVPVDGDTYDVAKQVEFAGAPPGGVSGYARKFGDAAAQKDLSAVTHVARGKGIPPFLLMHIAPVPTAGRSESGTTMQAHFLAKALQDAGVPVKVDQAEGKTHVSLDMGLGVPGDKPSEALFAFLDERIKAGR